MSKNLLGVIETATDYRYEDPAVQGALAWEASPFVQASEGRLRKGSISVSISHCPRSKIHAFLVVLRMQTIQMFL